MDTSERRPGPENTQELVAMWSAAKEQHFVQELLQLLPSLVGRTRLSENQPRMPHGISSVRCTWRPDPKRVFTQPWTI
jgi:hypothetical protein